MDQLRQLGASACHLYLSTLAEYFGKFFANAQTLYMIGNAEFEMVASDEVRVVWSMEDQIIISHYAEIRGGGYYLRLG